jgi:hypothetical protein
MYGIIIENIPMIKARIVPHPVIGLCEGAVSHTNGAYNKPQINQSYMDVSIIYIILC